MSGPEKERVPFKQAPTLYLWTTQDGGQTAFNVAKEILGQSRIVFQVETGGHLDARIKYEFCDLIAAQRRHRCMHSRMTRRRREVLARLPFSHAQKVQMGDAERLRDLVHGHDRWIPPAAFEVADVLLAESRNLGESLLCQPLLLPEVPYIVADELAHVHPARSAYYILEVYLL